MSWDSEAVAVAFLEAYATVYGTKAPRHRCEQLDRCAYDERCPFFTECELTDYTP